jgi:hypothetical protein
MRKRLLIDDLSESTLKKMQRLRINDGFGRRTWGKWFDYRFKNELMKESSLQVVDNSTRDNMLIMWVKSFALNLTDIRAGKTITDIVPENAEAIDKGEKPHLGSAVIVGAGPSVWNHKHLDLLKEYVDSGKYKGIVCTTDRMLEPCLERGIIPEISVGVDGSPIIKKFYVNSLVEKYASQLKIVINTTTDHGVVEHLKKIGAPIYWFNPLYDDPHRSNESFTKLQRLMTETELHPNGVPAITAGGNAGCATWIIANNLLRRGNLALIGMDMGYPEGTNLEETPYFSALQYAPDPSGLIGQFYKKIYHPTFKTNAYVDKIFAHYRESWRGLVLKTMPWTKTVNCTEGGTLFGEGIECMKFVDWLKT